MGRPSASRRQMLESSNVQANPRTNVETVEATIVHDGWRSAGRARERAPKARRQTIQCLAGKLAITIRPDRGEECFTMRSISGSHSQRDHEGLQLRAITYPNWSLRAPQLKRTKQAYNQLVGCFPGLDHQGTPLSGTNRVENPVAPRK
jgi:hypothetical protein